MCSPRREMAETSRSVTGSQLQACLFWSRVPAIERAVLFTDGRMGEVLQSESGVQVWSPRCWGAAAGRGKREGQAP